ncbi:hypothetical protein LRP88_05774 [Fusarium phalaenopsidis]
MEQRKTLKANDEQFTGLICRSVFLINHEHSYSEDPFNSHPLKQRGVSSFHYHRHRSFYHNLNRQLINRGVNVSLLHNLHTISTTAESTSASTAEATTTISITISTTEKPTPSTVIATASTTSSEPTGPHPNLGASSVEGCKAACLEAADCAFFLINKGSKACTLFKMSKEEAGCQKVPSAAYNAYERGCFVC